MKERWMDGWCTCDDGQTDRWKLLVHSVCQCCHAYSLSRLTSLPPYGFSWIAKACCVAKILSGQRSHSWPLLGMVGNFPQMGLVLSERASSFNCDVVDWKWHKHFGQDVTVGPTWCTTGHIIFHIQWRSKRETCVCMFQFCAVRQKLMSQSYKPYRIVYSTFWLATFNVNTLYLKALNDHLELPSNVQIWFRIILDI